MATATSSSKHAAESYLQVLEGLVLPHKRPRVYICRTSDRLFRDPIWRIVEKELWVHKNSTAVSLTKNRPMVFPI